MDLLPGLMVLSASLEGFSTAVAQVEIFELPSQLVTISLSPIDQKMRLVMNWGHLPDDLDLHVLQIDRSESNTSNIAILRQNADSTDMEFNQKQNMTTRHCLSGSLVITVKHFMVTCKDVLVFCFILTTHMVRKGVKKS